MRLLIIDFYDSFTYNLAHYFKNLNCEVDVVLEDKLLISVVYDHDCVVLSPGHLCIFTCADELFYMK